jgi:hypothetical protein
MVLLETFNKIMHYRESLNSTRISGFWLQVLWNRWDEKDLALFRMELSACQEPLNEVLMALNSYVLLVFLTLASTKTSYSTNAKPCLDGPWK